jgi:signal transduction histidine kinase
VAHLRTFTRLDEAEWKTVDLHQGLESTLVLTRHLYKSRVEIVRDLGDLPPVECRPGQINQIFINLIVNALQAIEGTGTIRIRTRRAGDRVRVEIQDSGPGMAPETQARLFTPGFTTKPAGQGTGLGLTICKRIARDHDGEITVASRVGEGTTFTLTLPVRRPPGGSPSSPAGPSPKS